MKVFVAWASLVLAAGPALSPPSADSELAAAQAYLDGQVAEHDRSGGVKGVPPEELGFYQFFTTYAVPPKWKWKDQEVDLRKNLEAALPFVLNSVAGVAADPFIVRPRRVPGSDTLWVIDIRDFGWARADVDAVFRLQPYLMTPLVDGRNPSMLFRADWFLVYATDAMKTDDRGVKQYPYYILQYGVGKEPKNKAEFEKAWHIDDKLAEKLLIETGSLVDKGDSGVSNHTRVLARQRTVLGYYWYTADTKSHDIDPAKVNSRDFLEDPKAQQVDARELIASNKRRLQTYLLVGGTNDNFPRVEFADPTLVWDRQDAHDKRVRTAKSCIVCHSFGIIPYTNALRELFATGAKLWAKDKALERELRAFYLTYKNGEEVKQDNDLFAQAIRDCNDLTPEDNLAAYLSVYDWYWNEKVTLEQAAAEAGLSVEDLKVAIRPATSARVVMLYHNKPMPREVWDSVNFGGYAQVVLLAKRLDEKARKVLEEGKAALGQGGAPVPAPAPAEVVVTEQTPLVDAQDRPVVYLGVGVRATVVETYDPTWYYVRSGQYLGYVRRAHVR